MFICPKKPVIFGKGPNLTILGQTCNGFLDWLIDEWLLSLSGYHKTGCRIP
jgi:hypothetical protein